MICGKDSPYRSSALWESLFGKNKCLNIIVVEVEPMRYFCINCYGCRVEVCDVGLKVEYDLLPLNWSWDHFSVEKGINIMYVNSLHFTEIKKMSCFF